METKQQKELMMKDLESILSNSNKNRKQYPTDHQAPLDSLSLKTLNVPSGNNSERLSDTKNSEKLLNFQSRTSDSDILPNLAPKKPEGEEKLRSKSLFGKIPSLSFGMLKKETSPISPNTPPNNKTINALVSPRPVPVDSPKDRHNQYDHSPTSSRGSDEVLVSPKPKDSPPGLSPKNRDFLNELSNITQNISLKINNTIVQQSSNQKPSTSPRDSNPLDTKDLQKGTVLYNFKAAQPNELSVFEGEIIAILKVYPDGWTLCVCKEKTGMIPTNYYRQVYITMGESYREKIVLEFFMTEITYVENLKRLVAYYVKPLEGVLPSTLISGMFGQIKVVIGVNSLFLDKLEVVLKNECTMLEREQKLADLLLNLAVTFKLYTAYITEFEKSCKLIREEMKKNKKMQQVIKDSSIQLKDAGCSIFDLNSYMILPIQRLPRYRLLIEDLLKHIPEDHVDNYNKVKQSRDAICKIVEYCNEKQREIEGSRGLFDVQKRFELPFRPNQKFIAKYIDQIKVGNVAATEWYILDNCLAFHLNGKNHIVYQNEVESVVKIPDVMSELKDHSSLCIKNKNKQELVIGVPKDLSNQLYTQLESWATETV